MARVTVYNTVGANESIVEFSGSTWAELQVELAANNVSYKGMAAIVGETQVTLESAQAMTPSTDFSLFLLPIEVKSGNDVEMGFDDEDEEDEDNDADYEPEVESFMSDETKLFIKQLEDAKAVINVILTTLRGKVITDPHIIEMQRKAAQLMASRR